MLFLLLVLAVGGLLFLFGHLFNSIASGPPDLLATNPPSDAKRVLPSPARVVAVLVLGIGAAFLGASALVRRRSRRALVVSGLLSLALFVASLVFVLGGTLERGAGEAPLEIESATTTPALLIVLGGIFLAFLGVAILRPRYLLPMLLLLALMPLIPDLFRLNPGAKEPSSPAQGGQVGQGGNQVEAASPDPALGTVLENGTLADLAASGAVSSPSFRPKAATVRMTRLSSASGVPWE